jgi:hypothetical protein
LLRAAPVRHRLLIHISWICSTAVDARRRVVAGVTPVLLDSRDMPASLRGAASVPDPHEETTMSNKIPAMLVLVADGGVRVFRNIGDDKALVLQQQDMLEPMNMNDDGPAGRADRVDRKQVDEATLPICPRCASTPVHSGRVRAPG